LDNSGLPNLTFKAFPHRFKLDFNLPCPSQGGDKIIVGVVFECPLDVDPPISAQFEDTVRIFVDVIDSYLGDLTGKIVRGKHIKLLCVGHFPSFKLDDLELRVAPSEPLAINGWARVRD
jgi:hypothetical protein